MKMTSTRPARAYRLLGMKAFLDADQDLVQWWDELPERQRSQVLRTVIRGYLGAEPASPFEALQTDIAGLNQGFSALRQQLDQLDRRLSSGDRPVEMPVQDGPSLSQSQQEQRMTRVIANHW